MDALDAYASDSDSKSSSSNSHQNSVHDTNNGGTTTTTTTGQNHLSAVEGQPPQQDVHATGDSIIITKMIQWEQDYITPKLVKQQQQRHSETTTTTAFDFSNIPMTLEQTHEFHNPHFLAMAHQRLGINHNNKKKPPNDNDDPTWIDIQTIMAKEEAARIHSMPCSKPL